MHRGQRPWVLRCESCGYLASTLTARIGEASHKGLREDRRAEALRPLRQHNFERVLEQLRLARAPRGAHLLEVGCAHGWFLDAAQARGYAVEGIEPDVSMAGSATARSHIVTRGFFPADVRPGKTFEVIVFNDVFEHLPDPAAALDACRDRLHERGLLVLNLPSSRGIFFRLAAALDRIGVKQPYQRMWQFGFPSPHLSYFSPATIDALAARHGFERVYAGKLASFDVHGLWSRLRYGGTSPALVSALTWLAIVAATPVFRLGPADIALHIYRLRAKG